MPGSTFLQPTTSAERINSMDVIRGVALLGILLMNIVGFGLFEAYGDPTNSGGATGWNLKVWWTANMFFEGTMRGMFSMLFGAGIVLFTARKSSTANEIPVSDAFFRRLTWLLLFGVIHSYLLLWDGEILYPYALLGMIMYSFRNLRPKHLIIGTVICCMIGTTLTVKDYLRAKKTEETAAVATGKIKNGLVPTKAEDKAMKDWESELAGRKVTPEELSEKITAMNQDYFSVVQHHAAGSLFMQTTFIYLHVWDIMAMMLLGMAFLKNGILKAARSTSFYLIMALASYAVGLTTNYFETNYLVSHQFSVPSFYLTDMTYELGRVFTTMGHVALIMLFVKSGLMPFLQKALAAVGQMAFTNYIMQTIICNTIFLGIGFGMYGKLQRYELYFVVLGIWLLQLILSPLWLSRFRFGPLEWAWRSLTYWQRPGFRKPRLSNVFVPAPTEKMEN